MEFEELNKLRGVRLRRKSDGFFGKIVAVVEDCQITIKLENGLKINYAINYPILDSWKICDKNEMEWEFKIEKTYCKEDGVNSLEEAREQFIKDVSENNFEIEGVEHGI